MLRREASTLYTEETITTDKYRELNVHRAVALESVTFRDVKHRGPDQTASNSNTAL